MLIISFYLVDLKMFLVNTGLETGAKNTHKKKKNKQILLEKLGIYKYCKRKEMHITHE